MILALLLEFIIDLILLTAISAWWIVANFFKLSWKLVLKPFLQVFGTFVHFTDTSISYIERKKLIKELWAEDGLVVGEIK